MQNLSQLNCFIKVAEFKSFTLAAKMLHLSTTAVSKQIKNLEHLIGEQVLIRDTRTVQLTEFGELFYQRCKAVDNELRVLEQFIESKKAEPQGNLKVLANAILSKKFIMDHLKRYMKRYPKVTLEIDFSQFYTDLSRQDVDIMVGFSTYAPFTESLKFRKMYEVNNIVCASPQFIKRYGLPKTGADLLKFKVIGHGPLKPNYSFPLADGNFLATATPILYLSDFDAVTQAGLAGIGIFLTGDLLAQTWLDSGDLIQILPQYKFKQHEIFMFYRAYDFELLKVRSFIDFYNRVQAGLPP